jgi:hypothetical protein
MGMGTVDGPEVDDQDFGMICGLLLKIHISIVIKII